MSQHFLKRRIRQADVIVILIIIITSRLSLFGWRCYSSYADVSARQG